MSDRSTMKCPKCGFDELFINDIYPPIYNCQRCKYSWRPVNKDGPRELTKEEMVNELLGHVQSCVDYWEGLEGKSSKEKLEGLAFSLLVMIDGGAQVGPFNLTPVISDDDIEYLKAHNTNWPPRVAINEEHELHGLFAQKKRLET